MSNAELRKVIVAHLKLVATAIATDISNENLCSQKARQTVYDEWMLAAQHPGANPFELPQHKRLEHQRPRCTETDPRYETLRGQFHLQRLWVLWPRLG